MTVSHLGEYLGLSYSDFSVIAIKAIQELAMENDAYRQQLELQGDQITELESKYNALQAQLSELLETSSVSIAYQGGN